MQAMRIMGKSLLHKKKHTIGFRLKVEGLFFCFFLEGLHKTLRGIN